MIGVVVRYDDELHRLVRYGFDLIDQSGVVLVTRQLAVDEDYAIVRDADQRVPPAPVTIYKPGFTG